MKRHLIALLCASSAVAQDLLTAACWLVLAIFFVLINDHVRADYPALDLVLMAYQDVGIVAGFWFAWPAQLKSLFIVFTIALFDVDIYGPTCSFPGWGNWHVSGLMLCLPVA